MKSELLSPQPDENLVRRGVWTPDDKLVAKFEEEDVEAEEDGGESQREMLDIPPPPEPHEAMRPKLMKAPSAPSRQERAEHNITHCPFRSWCETCVAGKSHAKSHFSGRAESPDSEVPLVAFDYAFMSDHEMKDLKPVGDESAEVSAETTTGDSQDKIIVGRDRKSRTYTAIAVPSKGVDDTEYATRRVLRFLDFLGYEKIILKSDQERALSSLIRKIKTHSPGRSNSDTART